MTFFMYTVCQLFITGWPLSRGYFQLVHVVAVAFGRGRHCRTVAIKVNVYTIHRKKSSGRCREVAVSGGLLQVVC